MYSYFPVLLGKSNPPGLLEDGKPEQKGEGRAGEGRKEKGRKEKGREKNSGDVHKNMEKEGKADGLGDVLDLLKRFLKTEKPPPFFEGSL